MCVAGIMILRCITSRSRKRCRSLPSIISRSPSATSRCSTTPACGLSAGNGSRWSAGTAPASRRCCASSAASSSPDAGTVWTRARASARTARSGRSALDRSHGLRRRRRRLGDLSELVAALSPRRRRGGRGRHTGPLAKLGACSTTSKSATAGASNSASSSCSRVSSCRPMPASTRSRADGGAACCSHGRWWPSPTCCCSTSRPTTSISTPSSGSRRSSPTTRARVVFVTHDRAFLQRVATRIVEIDRGRLTSWPGDYATFLRKKDEWLANEAVDAGEVRQAAGGRGSVAAPGRQGAADAQRRAGPRADGDARGAGGAARAAGGRSACRSSAARPSGQLVFEADDVTKSFGDRSRSLRDFSTRIMRGDRIGLIGPNGAARRRCCGCCSASWRPTAGEVRRGANVEVAYYDQQREQLDPERTVFDTLGDGNDTVTVDGRSRHVNALPARLPVPARARAVAGQGAVGRRAQPAAAGAAVHAAGQRAGARRADQRPRPRDARAPRSAARRVARHAAARQPRSRVSRQRRHQHARVRRKRPGAGIRRRLCGLAAPAARHLPTRRRRRDRPAPRARTAPKKRSYREQRELDELPARIEALEAEQRALGATIADPGFYRQPAATITAALDRTQKIERELGELYSRWDALDSRAP